MGSGYSNPMNIFIFHPPETKPIKDYKKIDSCGDKISLLEIVQNNSPRVVIYSHGNATDIEILNSFLHDVSAKIKTTIVAYSYSGYLDSDSYSTVDKCVQNLRDVYRYVKKKYPDKKIVLLGRSLGTHITIKFASSIKNKNLKMVLETPMSDLCDIGKDTLGLPKSLTFFLNSLDSYSCLDKIKCPTMIIGAEEDKLTPYRQSKKIYCKLNKNKSYQKVKLIKIKNAGHNDFINVMGFDKYCRKLFCFIYSG